MVCLDIESVRVLVLAVQTFKHKVVGARRSRLEQR
eukprot:CAMPEP_0184210554 /NCGR_PEP_ID=MMETSP0976-20121227/12672_1 /TAXON_ID=483370 /ORGANISM="non described non described, Strain CCMP2097" /LENGTH=34 /DNA_ID= /DNA_START= /DNA_END= /DNA_ORIENTATION=